MQDIKGKIAELMCMIREKLTHSYLEKYIQAPIIDEEKLLLVHLLLNEIPLSKQQISNYTISSMLVQIALDTHEAVTNKAATNLPYDYLKNRQLTVLAGDYYSGLYYYYLAEYADINMIRTLAESIREINEQKIVLYQLEANTFDKLMETVEAIESSLFKKISNYFHFIKWDEIASKYLLLKRLEKERKLFIEHGESSIFKTMHKIYKLSDCLEYNVIEERGNENHLLHIFDTYSERINEFIRTSLLDEPKNNDFIFAMNELMFNNNNLSDKNNGGK